MASYLTFVNFTNLRKNYTVLDRTNPFDELEDEEFRRRFRITKSTALLLLSEVSCYYTLVNLLLVILNFSYKVRHDHVHSSNKTKAYWHTSSGIPCGERTSPLLRKGCKR